MTSSRHKILAVNPGTRYIGIAVIEGPELLDWGIKAVSGKWSIRKEDRFKAMIIHLIEKYQPDILTLKKLHPSRSSANLASLNCQILRLADDMKLITCSHTITEIEAAYHSDKRINKRKLAEIVSTNYPFLRRLLKREDVNSNPYYLRMFEAIALAFVCSSHFSGK